MSALVALSSFRSRHMPLFTFLSLCLVPTTLTSQSPLVPINEPFCSTTAPDTVEPLSTTTYLPLWRPLKRYVPGGNAAAVASSTSLSICAWYHPVSLLRKIEGL